jgi:hypothetical protein
MKNNAFRSLLTLAGTCALTFALLAQEVSFDSVAAKGGKSYGRKSGQDTELTNAITFANSIVINTNATFKVGSGAERSLRDGQVLSNDGRLTDTDGSISPVLDHVTKKANAIKVVKDGVATALTSPLTLGDGSIVSPDGYLTVKGTRKFIVEGQIIQLSGEKIEAVDTATIQGGQVIVQKDGQSYKIARSSSMTMNDGTRIFGTGRVRKFNGEELTLKEGEIMRIEGVTTK